jgi:hypothetical protein
MEAKESFDDFGARYDTWASQVRASLASGRLQLKRFSSNERLSQETTAFAADVYLDGKKVATADNDGHGGETCVHGLSAEANAALDAYEATLPPGLGGANGSKTTIEAAVDQLVEGELQKKARAKDRKFAAKAAAQGFKTFRLGSDTAYLLFTARTAEEAAVAGAKHAKKHRVANVLVEVLP